MVDVAAGSRTWRNTRSDVGNGSLSAINVFIYPLMRVYIPKMDDYFQGIGQPTEQQKNMFEQKLKNQYYDIYCIKESIRKC